MEMVVNCISRHVDTATSIALPQPFTRCLANSAPCVVSPCAQFAKKKHTSDHFLFTRDEICKMNLPGLTGSIPHYLIYGRDGHFIKSISGWRGLKTTTEKLDNALEE